MLGAGLQFNRSRNGEDRLYSAARARLNQDSLRRAQSDTTSSHSRNSPDESLAEKSNPEVPATSQMLEVEPSPVCNLERFLESVTPLVPAQYVSKMMTRSWRTSDLASRPYFILSDLWESFNEWSAYGVGVPLILNDHDSVVQYYVPYLSGIQLYTDPSKKRAKLRCLGKDSDADRDSSSDGSSDSEPERSDLNYPVEKLREQRKGFQEGFSSDEGESGNSQGCLLFGYLERDPPYCREPLSNKISDLSKCFPELKTLKSCDLLPSSWISVSWYPIYRIPTGPTLRDLDACFLTFHSLHTPLTGGETMLPPTVIHPTEVDGVPQISLPVFGLASYKYKASLWTQNTVHQQEFANSLQQAADNWLNFLQVHHPDFSFFRRW